MRAALLQSEESAGTPSHLAVTAPFQGAQGVLQNSRTVFNIREIYEHKSLQKFYI